MEKCKYCESKELFMKPKIDGENVMSANMVGLYCAACGKWNKWVKKEDRAMYSVKFTADDVKESLKNKVEGGLTEKNIIDTANAIIPKPQIVTDTLDSQLQEYAIAALLDVRKMLLHEPTYTRSMVIGTIDNKIRQIRNNKR